MSKLSKKREGEKEEYEKKRKDKSLFLTGAAQVTRCGVDALLPAA